MLTHGYLLKYIIDSVMMPLVKNINGILSDKDNHKPIALASVISKILFTRCEEFLWTTDDQDGLKKDCHYLSWKPTNDSTFVKNMDNSKKS